MFGNVNERQIAVEKKFSFCHLKLKLFFGFSTRSDSFVNKQAENLSFFGDNIEVYRLIIWNVDIEGTKHIEID